MNDQNKKKSYLSIFEEVSSKRNRGENQNGHAYLSDTEEIGMEEEENWALTDELDHEILMHRDAHFNGDFSVMLRYYQEDRVGTHPDFEVERIAYLAEVENQTGQDLAPLILTGAEAERVSRARRAYEKLKEIYELEEEEKNPFPRLIADLILSEEEEPEEAVEAIVSQGTRIVPELLQIIRSEEAYDPIFPGYGYAPYLAILCVAKIRDPSSVIPLFEILGHEMMFDEEVVLEAFYEIGDPAKDFLLNTLKGRPLTKDTVNAAYALGVFADQEDVAIFCFEQLQDQKVIEKPLLRSYLLNNCEALRKTPYFKQLKSMVNDPQFPSDFRLEIESRLNQWQLGEG